MWGNRFFVLISVVAVLCACSSSGDGGDTDGTMDQNQSGGEAVPGGAAPMAGGQATGGTAVMTGGSAMAGGAPTAGTPSPVMTQWYETCGDPVCSGNDAMGLMPCGDKAAGDSCDEAGATCDLGNNCNVRLVCAATDPKGTPEMCPRSKAKYKNNIEYLSKSDRKALADAANQIKLARWRYIRAPERERIGFIIDDKPHPALVQSDGEHVDLYGYTSLAVAALQQQSQEIKELRKALETLSARVSQCTDKASEK